MSVVFNTIDGVLYRRSIPQVAAHVRAKGCEILDPRCVQRNTAAAIVLPNSRITVEAALLDTTPRSEQRRSCTAVDLFKPPAAASVASTRANRTRAPKIARAHVRDVTAAPERRIAQTLPTCASRATRTLQNAELSEYLACQVDDAHRPLSLRERGRGRLPGPLRLVDDRASVVGRKPNTCALYR